MSTKREIKNEHKPSEEALSEEQLESVSGGVIVQSPSTSGRDAVPIETISLNYEKITFNY